MSVISAWQEYVAATAECDPEDYEYVELWAWQRLQGRLRRLRDSHQREEDPQGGKGEHPLRPVGDSDGQIEDGKGQDWGF